MVPTHSAKTQGPHYQSAADPVSQTKSNSAAVPLIDNRPEAVAQRKLQALADNSPRISQLQAFQQMADRHTSQPPVQLKVDKYRAGAWFSSYDPYTTFWTKKQATDYDRKLKGKGREELRARVPTLYTYTHTKPANKLSYALQGPHTVAHRVILQSLIDSTTVTDVFKIFDEQVLEPSDVEEVVFQDEVPPSGSFAKSIQDRLTRFVEDYEEIYDKVLPMFTQKTPDLITIKHLTNRLLNMDPYAVYAWKTTTKASQKSLGGKGENVTNPTWNDVYDAPPSSSIRSQPNLSSFINSRQDLFNQHF